jgi:hypothetical protein
MKTTYPEPAWLKLQGGVAYCNLSYSEIYRRCITGEIESVHVVQPGKRKGVRLIKKSSLDQYIESFLPGGSRYQKHLESSPTK